MTVPALLLVLAVFAGPAHATTVATTPDCAEHGHDAGHNPHCDESTTTTTGEATTTTTSLLDLPTNPTTTSLFVAPTTTSTSGPTVAPPHLDLPAVLPTTTTTAPAGVLGHHKERLPTTGTPAAFLAAVGVLCLLCGGGVLRARRQPG